ncbi:hypothetical protein GLT92_00965 [Nanohaloarchaea archaeon]|nr:hypothetical protein [Candidatus Nanohaloarchaea archaeon]
MGFRLAIFWFMVLFLVPATFGQTATEANSSLRESEEIIREMNRSNIPTQRVSDLYERANESYVTQLERNRSGKESDYSMVLNTVEQIEEIRTEAFRTKDQLDILRSRIKELNKSRDLNLSGAREELEEAEIEYRDERFERSRENIDLAYQEISEAQSAVTQAQAFASATRDKFQTFLINNWKKLSATLVILSALFYLLYKEYRIYSLEKKKQNLKQKREVIQDLTSEAQEEYFQENDMAESAYNTRTDKYGEMIRDINRQIPLIDEDLEKEWSPSQVINQKILDRYRDVRET